MSPETLLERAFFFDRWVAATADRWYAREQLRQKRANHRMLRAIGIKSAFDRKLDQVKAAMRALALTIGARLVPVFQRAVQAFNDFAAALAKLDVQSGRTPEER